jgi:hypothetical protein
LLKIYSEIYALVSSAKFSAEYVESLSPIERILILENHVKYQNENLNDLGDTQGKKGPSINKDSLPTSELLGDLEGYM